jgi:uncharacterized protein YyaL (SSP411 family)
MKDKISTCIFFNLSLLLIGFMISSARCEDAPANLLINESSPYLLKHATNPVNWHPWGEEAFTLAREKGKPVLLSIGYLTCHWCNVMEEESFSDPQVAALINDVFIPVKVDREERPDIDQIYMKACHLLSPSCGWPLTLFLSPEGKPFYAATYIPKENRFGRLGLLELIPRVKELWSQERESVLKSADSINAAIISSTIQLPGGDMAPSFLDTSFQVFSQDFDSRFGGFGRNAKFPKPLNLLFLLRYWHRTGDKEALAMVEKTLTAMRQGGIYDHLGYGIHRYTTDSMWRVPHFEKMLYDQALLIMAYLEAYQATTKKKYAETAKEILDYVLQYLTSKEGGFYSAESADSDGEEGKFYLWSAAEIRKALNPQEAAAASRIFNISEDGNYVDPVADEKTGKNILFTGELDSDSVAEYKTIRKKMLAARNSRLRPELDDKVLTDWNGLMIGALAKGAQILNQPEYGEAAKRAARFILLNLRSSDEKLLHRWRNGRAGIAATAADYSFMTWGLLELYGWDFDTYWLQQALGLTTILIKNYWDDKLGGFYLTEIDEKSILPRIKESIDTSLPSSNAVSIYNLLRLSRLTGSTVFEEKAEKISRLLSSSVKNSPLAFPMLLSALDFALAPSQEVVIVGRQDTADTQEMLKILRINYFPNAVILFKPAGEQPSPIDSYAHFVEFMYAIDNKATAYVCTNFKCNFPTTDPAEMLNSLNSISKNSQKDVL